MLAYSVCAHASLHSLAESLTDSRLFCVCVCVGVCVCGGVCVCVCLAYTSEDFHMKTPRHTEDSTPSEDPKTGPRKTLAKNAENVMFYHLRGVRAPRTSMDFQPYLIYEDIRVLGSISKASRGVCVCVLRGHSWVHFAHRVECTVTLNSNFAIEPIVLRKKGDGFLLFLKSIFMRNRSFSNAG